MDIFLFLVACLTVKIRNLQRHVSEMRTDKITRVNLQETIDRRKALLKHLRRIDYKRYEWLLEKLDLVYYTQPK